MKIILWIYAVVGNLYFLMFLAGNEVVEMYASGLFFLLMMGAPVVLVALVLLQFAGRLGSSGK